MRRSLVLAACGLLVAAAAGVSVWRIPGAARDAQGTVDAVAGLGRLDRGLAAGREFDLETETYVAAEQVIPRGATYAVITGTHGITVSSPLSLFKAPVFAGYWFLPRRQVSDPHQADWIYSYGGDLSSLGLRYRRIVILKPGWEVAEVAR
jgi:hypothetical protein